MSKVVDLSEVEFASFPQRIAARIIDVLIVSTMFAVFISFTGLEVKTDGGFSDDLGLGAWIWFLPVIYFGYEVPGIATRGQTLGKRIMGLMIVKTDGQVGTGLDGALTRFLSMIVLGSIPFIGWLAVCWYVYDPKRQNVPDKIANTFVVRTPEGLFSRAADFSQDSDQSE